MRACWRPTVIARSPRCAPPSTTRTSRRCGWWNRSAVRIWPTRSSLASSRATPLATIANTSRCWKTGESKGNQSVSDETVTLKQVYAGWDIYNGYLIKAVAPLTPEQLQLRPAANLRNVYAIVTHIIGARARWFSQLLGEGGETMAELGTWDRPGQPERNAAALEIGLEKSWGVIADCLSRWT